MAQDIEPDGGDCRVFCDTLNGVGVRWCRLAAHQVGTVIQAREGCSGLGPCRYFSERYPLFFFANQSRFPFCQGFKVLRVWNNEQLFKFGDLCLDFLLLLFLCALPLLPLPFTHIYYYY